MAAYGGQMRDVGRPPALPRGGGWTLQTIELLDPQSGCPGAIEEQRILFQ